MTSKTFLIILIVFLALVILFPFVLYVAGVGNFQFGAVGGERRSGAAFLRSADEGKSWSEIRVEENGFSPREILNIAFHPQNPAILYLGAKAGGLWKSDNRGQSWMRINDTSGTLRRDADVYKIALASSSPDILYLAVFQDKRGRVLKSDNGGTSFREMLFVTADNFGVFDIYVHPANADHVIAVTGQGGVLESTNGGETWSIKRWFSEALRHILVNPNFPNEFFVLTSSGKLWKTFDGGENWADLNKALRKAALENSERMRYQNPFFTFQGDRGNIIEHLFPDPNVFSTLYLASSLGLLRSINGGFSWEYMKTLIPPEALPVSAIAAHPFRPMVLFAAASNQIHRSDDGGEKWSVSIIDAHARITELIIDPKDPMVMFAVIK